MGEEVKTLEDLAGVVEAQSEEVVLPKPMNNAIDPLMLASSFLFSCAVDDVF